MSDKSPEHEPSRLIAYVRSPADHGPILSHTGQFTARIEEDGISDIEDLEMPMSSNQGFPGGLLVFEGWIETGVAGDPTDYHLVGDWRPLEHWEICRLRFGLDAFTGERL